MGYPTKKLGDLCKIQNGFAFKSSDYIEKSNTLNFRMSNIRIGGGLDLNHNNKYLPDEYIIKYSNFLLKDGDIVIAMTDMATDPKILAIPTIIIKDNRNLLLNQRVGRFIDINFQILDINYLRFILLSPEIRKKLVSMGGGGVQINISTKQILSIPIPLPTLSTQKLIVQKLDSSFEKIDKSIELTKKNLENIEELNKSVLEDIFNKLVIKFGFSSISKTVLNPRGDIVDGPFGSNLKSGEYKNEGLPLIRLQNVSRYNFIDKDIKYVSVEKYNQLKRHTYIKGDIVITKLGAPLGKACVVPDNFEKGVIVADIIRVRIDNNKNSTKFITYMINSINCGNQFIGNTQGSTRPRVKLTLVRELQIPLPPLEKQKEIVAQLDKVFEKNKALKQSYEKKLKDLEEMKQSLLKEAFEGRLVKE